MIGWCRHPAPVLVLPAFLAGCEQRSGRTGYAKVGGSFEEGVRWT